MPLPLLTRVRSKLRRLIKPEYGFLKHVPGVIHIGANVGQERDLYAQCGLNVLWVEPIPEVFEKLCANIAAYPKQKAYRRLITDQDGQEYTFHVASNGGASSSILPLAKHTEMYPEISFDSFMQITGTTLNAFLKKEGLDVSDYGALVLDTQGSELHILRGASSILRSFKYVRLEAADFEAYEGCCRIGDLSAFLREMGFRENRRSPFNTTPGVGTYYDVLYEQARN
jgi:FkbM family methyltransferase